MNGMIKINPILRNQIDITIIRNVPNLNIPTQIFICSKQIMFIIGYSTIMSANIATACIITGKRGWISFITYINDIKFPSVNSSTIKLVIIDFYIMEILARPGAN